MACNCINTISERLEEHTLDTAIMWSLGDNRLKARTYTSLNRKDNGRAESRSKKPRIFAHTFCPFCGDRYDPEPTPDAGVRA